LPTAVANGAPPLRSLIEARLRGTAPGGDPLQAWIAGLSPEQSVDLRKFVPAQLSRAAVLVPLVDRPQGLSLLLTQRATHLKHHPGQISFPGGRMEPGDEGPWDAALRETEEEIGLARKYVSLAGYLHDHVVITGYLVTPVVAFVRPGFDLQLDRTEVEEVFEVPLEYVLDPAHHVPRERHYAGHTLRSFDIPYEGRNIWGATAGMLMSFSRLLQGA
jgi:8-oxo-dGTP pyrophosphatase MutT (NUDIX family)